jgi:hypothetical protein
MSSFADSNNYHPDEQSIYSNANLLDEIILYFLGISTLLYTSGSLSRLVFSEPSKMSGGPCTVTEESLDPWLSAT